MTFFALLKLPSEPLALFQSDNTIVYWQTDFNRVGVNLLFVKSLRKMNGAKEGAVVFCEMGLILGKKLYFW